MVGISEAATTGVVYESYSYRFWNIQRKHLCWGLFSKKLQILDPQLFYKENPTQVFSYEYYKVFNIAYFEKHLQADAF